MEKHLGFDVDSAHWASAAKLKGPYCPQGKGQHFYRPWVAQDVFVVGMPTTGIVSIDVDIDIAGVPVVC